MTTITFEKFKKEFPELCGRYELCERCAGEGQCWLEHLEVWWFCLKCHGEGSVLQDHKVYEDSINSNLVKLQVWIAGKPLKAKPVFQRLDIVSNLEFTKE